MKKLMLALIMLGGIVQTANAQEDLDAITRAIEKFATAGDHQDETVMAEVLHPQYRVVWNDPGKGTLTVLDRDTYLDLIRSKKIGGDKRTVQIESIELINGDNALIKTSLKGEKADFQSLLSLVKNEDGDWFLIQDQVFMAVK